MKYKSIVPKKPKALNSYNTFLKEHFASIAGENPNALKGEIHTLVSERWKELTDQQKEEYKLKSVSLAKSANIEWMLLESEREETRKKTCDAFGMSRDTDWDDLDKYSEKLWNQKHPQSASAKPKKSKHSDDDESDSGDDIQLTTSIATEKKRRLATENALVNMKKQKDAIDFADESEDDHAALSDEENKSLKKLKSKSSVTTVGTGGMMSQSQAKGGVKATTTGSSNSTASGLKKRTSRIGDNEWETAQWKVERINAVKNAIDR